MLQFTAVPQSVGAPLRTVTVRDVIADLPAIQNGHDQAEMQYSGLHLFSQLSPHCIDFVKMWNDCNDWHK